jgi:galactonate dehydratase
MKISKVTPLVIGTEWRNLVVVKVETDEGLVGVGESRPLNSVDTLLGCLNDMVPRYVLGSDPFDIERLTYSMFREHYARNSETSMTVLAMIEVACWDIIGKALNQPVYRLLGGAVRDRIKAYANGWYTVERTPEEFHQAAQRVVERGYRALKLDPFGAAFTSWIGPRSAG